MLPHEQGLAFAMLLHYRVITDNPQRRSLRRNESEATRILSNCSEAARHDFDEFMASQGLAVKTYDGINFGIIPNPKCTNQIHILHRRRGEKLAPYFDQGWFIDAMKDQRSKATRPELVVWFTRLWLTLQYFFYNKISRHPQQVSQYDRALVFTERFIEVVRQEIEALGHAGRPEGEAGAMWDILWNDSVKVETLVNRFIRVMLQAEVIEETGVKGEYRQTLSAAVDMAVIADYELAYLMPSDDLEDIESRSYMLISGSSIAVPIVRKEVGDASNQ